MWEVEFTDEFDAWWESLTENQQDAVNGRVLVLTEEGPDLGRPIVDHIKTSRHPNMKELRASASGNLRVLFAFDPRRQAILLIGGNKDRAWQSWYQQFVPIADDLYDEHLRAIADEP